MEQKHADRLTPADAVAAAPPAEAVRAAEGAAESPAALHEALSDKTQEVERLRLQAEFDNYKKRMTREKAEFLKFAHEGLILDFLPVLDNLERALDAARSEAGSTPLLEGIEMIARLFRSVLERAGVRSVEALGQPFDPAYHQAVAQVETSQGGAGLVVEEIQKGYLIEGRVLRPAMVKVSRAVSPESGGGGGDEGGQT
jgi:molecular chaperone GrpE